MKLAAIWRYPVKSMAGESMTCVPLLPDGLAGDRNVQVYDHHGRLLTARTHPRLLAHDASLGPDGEPLVDGLDWRSPEVAARVSERLGQHVVLRRVEAHRFDILPLLVATDGALEAFGRDPRRLRPNLVIGGVEGLAERHWEGRALGVGEAIVTLADLRGRCVMTTYDPDSQAQEPAVLRDIVRRFGGSLCLNASVDRAALVSLGARVRLL